MKGLVNDPCCVSISRLAPPHATYRHEPQMRDEPVLRQIHVGVRLIIPSHLIFPCSLSACTRTPKLPSKINIT